MKHINIMKVVKKRVVNHTIKDNYTRVISAIAIRAVKHNGKVHTKVIKDIYPVDKDNKSIDITRTLYTLLDSAVNTTNHTMIEVLGVYVDTESISNVGYDTWEQKMKKLI